jgi:hypothetical protein
MDTVVILGAGFSRVAGLPLTNNLFDCGNILPPVTHPSMTDDYIQVIDAYKRWRAANQNESAEVWMNELYSGREMGFVRLKYGTDWWHVVRFVLARLVDDTPESRNAPYYHGIGTFRRHPVHEQFWERAERELNVKRIVTFNYDLLVEQALHEKQSDHRTAPRCRYGGFTHVQVVRKLTNVITRTYDLLEMGNDFVLYKLHGSMNWAWERHSPTLKVHQDVRAVFRRTLRVGQPAIIPPVSEKEMPKEFATIWFEAAEVLANASRWLVCGYSLPTYDIFARKYFADILKRRRNTTVVILDPDSRRIGERWRDLAAGVNVLALPGLPEALAEAWS